jgi:uncharacterized protein YjbI with pentapeptide repeats
MSEPIPQPVTRVGRGAGAKSKTGLGNQPTQSASTPAQPANENLVEWKTYWLAREQPWRTEPEIEAERQRFLAKQRSIPPDAEQGWYPFKDVTPSRADVEWLLVTHEDGRGPIDWRDKSQRAREGLDLRGADLRSVNLSGLPLAKLQAGMGYWSRATAEQHGAAIAHLEGASLVNAHLEGAILEHVHMERADLSSAHLEHATLNRAHLDGTWLANAHLEDANLREAHLEEATLNRAHLERANLRNVYMDHTTKLEGMILGDGKSESASLIDVHWNGANLAVVNWASVRVLGDETLARLRARAKDPKSQLPAFEEAVRAYRQLAVALREQGLNEVADHFIYRAQLLQRTVLRLQRHWLKYLFSWFLALLTGYGYRMGRIIVAYFLLILVFATAYWSLGVQHPRDISFWMAIIISVTAFHGRVFSNPFTPNLLDGQVIVTAIEAVCGLVIEGVFIAMLTQKFFSR